MAPGRSAYQTRPRRRSAPAWPCRCRRGGDGFGPVVPCSCFRPFGREARHAAALRNRTLTGRRRPANGSFARETCGAGRCGGIGPWRGQTRPRWRARSRVAPVMRPLDADRDSSWTRRARHTKCRRVGISLPAWGRAPRAPTRRRAFPWRNGAAGSQARVLTQMHSRWTQNTRIGHGPTHQ